MKIQGTLNGIKIDIDCPELVQQDGKWWEPVEFRKVQEGEYYWASGLFESKICFKTMQAPIYREIPEPSQEWLDANGYEKSERPEVDKASCGKYRFKLTKKQFWKPKEDCITAVSRPSELVCSYLKNEITAGQLLTKLEELK